MMNRLRIGYDPVIQTRIIQTRLRHQCKHFAEPFGSAQGCHDRNRAAVVRLLTSKQLTLLARPCAQNHVTECSLSHLNLPVNLVPFTHTSHTKMKSLFAIFIAALSLLAGTVSGFLPP
jgi:hypothetical protein